MGLVPRRVLEPILRENARFLRADQARRQVDDVDRRDAQSLASEYEVLLLNALSKVGCVSYEPNLGGAKRPDVLFSSSTPDLTFVADITCVSDVDAYRSNPVEDLQNEFRRLLKRHGLRAGGFFFGIEGGETGPPGPRKPRLTHPSPAQLPGLLQDRAGFVREVAAAPARSRRRTPMPYSRRYRMSRLSQVRSPAAIR